MVRRHGQYQNQEPWKEMTWVIGMTLGQGEKHEICTLDRIEVAKTIKWNRMGRGTVGDPEVSGCITGSSLSI